MKMSDEAFKELPVITTEDLKNCQEKYRILLGSWEFLNSTSMLVNVEAIVDFLNDPKYYIEGEHSIYNIDVFAIKKFIGELPRYYPEYQSLKLVGEFHSHPVMKKDLLANDRSWYLSEGDMKNLIFAYEYGLLDTEQPFLTGVGGAMDDGKTGYVFYRLIKEGKKYYIKLVDWQ